MAPSWTQSAQWIWTPNYHEEDNRPGRYFLFRKLFEWSRSSFKAERFSIHVSADSRYRLFVNGHRVSFGPCKSYPEKWYYETVDILPYLVEGENVISARVLRYSCTHAGSASIVSTELPGLMVYGESEGINVSTDETWKCVEETSRQIVPYSEWNYILGPPFTANNERVIEAAPSMTDWTLPGFSDSAWSNAVLQLTATKMLPIQSPWKLSPRPFPALPEEPGRFDGVVKCRGSITLDQWNALLKEDEKVVVPAGTTVVVDIQSESLTTAFVTLRLGRGKGSKISLLYSECYEKDLGVETAPFPMPRTKSNRADSSGRLYGMKDFYLVVDGQEEQVFEPFWFRAFRYIQLEIICSDEPLTVKEFTLRQTHYPLEISTQIRTGTELDKIWDISLKTLQNCRHETYEDCPFYEQNQFASDSRLQMLFTYQISSDDRLARKTLEEFHASRGPDGLIKAQFPAGFRSTQIPQFSLFYVSMVYDHMSYFADKPLVRRYLGTVDSILCHFEERINDLGLVGRFDDNSWPFIDWVKEWIVPGNFAESCMPQSYTVKGAATFNSLLYAVALMQAAELCDFVGRSSTADEYRMRADSIRKAVNRHCFKDGLYLDGPNATDEYSQHSQVFAILSETTTGPAAQELIQRTLKDSSLAQCSYSMNFYLFRAVEKTGLYTQLFQPLMEPWREMMADNLTTWAEHALNSRSDCHGWSAGPIHEIVTQVFGLKPSKPGFQCLRLEPRCELLETAQGTFCTPVGQVKISWNADAVTFETVADIQAEVVLDGSVIVKECVAGRPFCIPRSKAALVLS
ncbi:hypothetical protein ASPZODRAFT_130749 [Penicilliopsis zonata CBS 506.65]|uniref:Alpha-L-rhamnosidase n=1 Tax=Penicilliopsis zonata CBS 506.65 TaxID=1073090 RepID=A0A1L9SNE7_9EURO|nr:hypothetical protein ASPZODRAFT_130749 [Penicilliopsis zonata CBS 506.65]OJJ48646.1 hypothetical protein ASPZODRAFT_130749 [Penicilliopsis zonata CBS 506.65]